MQHLEVRSAVRHIYIDYISLCGKGLKFVVCILALDSDLLTQGSILGVTALTIMGVGDSRLVTCLID
jgi:hypothetical protein